MSTPDRTRLWFAAAMLFVFACSAAAQHEAADKLYQAGKYEKALAAYQSSMKAGKGGASGAGRSLIRLNRVLEAVKLLESAVDEGDESAQTRVVLGEALYWNALSFQNNDPAFAMTRFEEAVSQCQSALEIDPKLGEAYRTIGRIRFAQKNNDDGYENLRKAVEVDPADGMNHFELARTLHTERKFAEAATNYEAAAKAFAKAKKETEQRNAMVSAAFCFDQAGDAANAGRAYESAFSLDKTNSSLFAGIWSLYATQPDRQEAGIALLEKLSAVDPKAAYPKLYLAYLHRARKSNGKAKKILVALAKTSAGRKLADVPALLGEMALADGDDGKAEKLLFQSLKIDPKNNTAAGLMNDLVGRSVQSRDYREAIRITKRYLKLRPNHAQGWSSLAGLYHSRRDLKGSIPYYKKAMELDPNNPQFSANAAKMYNDLNRNDEAEKMWKHSLGIRPDDIDTLMNLGWFYKRMGRNAEAKVQFERVLELNPDHGRAARERDIVTDRLNRK